MTTTPLPLCCGCLAACLAMLPATSPAEGSGDWLQSLAEASGEVHKDRSHPWIQKVEFSGRLEYQLARIEGTDAKGADFDDHYDEYRRARLGVELDFLHHLEVELEINLVDDKRFRADPPRELDWGYDRFHEATLEFDLDGALRLDGVDDLKLTYGRMKLPVGAESHQSSRDILTIERSAISEKLSGEFSRPTGLTLEIEKDDWELVLGLFSGEDDADFIGGWNDGHFYYASLGWEPSEQLDLRLDYTQNHPHGNDDALGYAWAGAFSVQYEEDRWGITTVAVMGDNGAGPAASLARRQGDFKGLVLMPWYWVIEDQLQMVLQYQHASSSESQGLQLPSRYIRARHDNPQVDVDNGRGSRHQSLYAGLNYHIIPERLKLMGGVSRDWLETRGGGDLDATTWQMALRMSF